MLYKKSSLAGIKTKRQEALRISESFKFNISLTTLSCTIKIALNHKKTSENGNIWKISEYIVRYAL